MMALDEQIRDVVEPAPSEQRRPRAMLPGLPRLVALEAQSERHAVADRPGEHVRAPEPAGDHFGDALHLVRAASDALERMRTRYREIETFSSQQGDYYRGELSAAHALMRDLQEQNLTHEETIQRLEAQMRAEAEQRRSLEEALRTMSEAAEALRDQYQHVEARANSAEAWLIRFQGEIASAFGEIPRILGEINQEAEAEAASQSEQRRAAGGNG